jgi:Family of unknown function (DUF6504)
MLRVDEAVDVLVNQAGQPTHFKWRGERYIVVSQPVRWFARREWWVESARAYRGIGASVLELEMWRCAVRPDLAVSSQNSGANSGTNQGSAQFELVRSSVGNRWQLLRVYS